MISIPLSALLIGAGLLLAIVVILFVALVRSGPEGPGGSAVNLSGIIESLQGKKTYIVGTALLVIDQVHDLGWLSDMATSKTEKVLLVIAAFTLKAAQARVEKKQDVVVEQAKAAVDAATDATVTASQTQRDVKRALNLPVTPVSVPKTQVIPGSVL